MSPSVCPSCESGALELVLVLPGGKEVPDHQVPFSDGVKDVDSYERCRGCGQEYRDGAPEP